MMGRCSCRCSTPPRGLLDHLATLTKNTVQPQSGLPAFNQLTVPTPLQKQALELLEVDLLM